MAEGYLVTETVMMGQKQTIKLPAPVDKNAPDKDDLNIIRNKEIKATVKRRQKLEESLKKRFATVYKQCSQEVCVCVCVLTWAPAREDLFAILGTFKPCCMDPPHLAS